MGDRIPVCNERADPKANEGSLADSQERGDRGYWMLGTRRWSSARILTPGNKNRRVEGPHLTRSFLKQHRWMGSRELDEAWIAVIFNEVFAISSSASLAAYPLKSIAQQMVPIRQMALNTKDWIAR
jgi:hypothetical protein